MPDNDLIVTLISIISIFVALPAILIGGGLLGKVLKLKNAELEVRREELALQRQQLELRKAETNREILDKLERES